MCPTTDNNQSKKPKSSKRGPIELDRWEGEGGNPPPRTDPTPAITGILRRLFIDWHFANPERK